MEVNRSMASEPDETTSPLRYYLTCTNCEFETTVEGSVQDALDIAETHQKKYGEYYTEHFVDLELDD